LERKGRKRKKKDGSLVKGQLKTEGEVRDERRASHGVNLFGGRSAYWGAAPAPGKAKKIFESGGAKGGEKETEKRKVGARQEKKANSDSASSQELD